MAAHLFVLCAFLLKGIYGLYLPSPALVPEILPSCGNPLWPAYAGSLPAFANPLLPYSAPYGIAGPIAPASVLPAALPAAALPVIGNPPLSNQLADTLQLLTVSSLMNNKLPLGAFGPLSMPIAAPGCGCSGPIYW